jgi:ribosomal protein S18 acetylase RimI-like enzyme
MRPVWRRSNLTVHSSKNHTEDPAGCRSQNGRVRAIGGFCGMAIKISACEDKHISGLEALWKQCLPDDPLWEAAGVVAFANESPSTLFLVANDGADVIGSVMAGYDGHRGWLYALAVLPAYRFDHVATTLVIEAEKKLRAIGCTKINLQIRGSNAEAQQFYRTLGYATEDRISMGKRLEYR